MLHNTLQSDPRASPKVEEDTIFTAARETMRKAAGDNLPEAVHSCTDPNSYVTYVSWRTGVTSHRYIAVLFVHAELL